MIDFPPIKVTFVEKTSSVFYALSKPWELWFRNLYPFLTRTQNYGLIGYTAPSATGFSYTIPQSVGVVVIEPAAVYANGATILPSNPFDSEQVTTVSTKDVTAFALTAGSGETVLSAPTALVGGVGFSYIYRKA